jgi:hypothetical protein
LQNGYAQGRIPPLKVKFNGAFLLSMRDTNEVQCQELTAVNFERTNWFEKWNHLPDPAAEQIQ